MRPVSPVLPRGDAVRLRIGKTDAARREVPIPPQAVPLFVRLIEGRDGKELLFA